MRGSFLLALLIGVAILLYLWSTHTATVSRSNTQMREELAPITGRVPDGQGADISNSAEFESIKAGLNVLSVKPKSYFDRFFGLQAGDVITVAGDVDLADTDENSAEAFVFQAAQQKRSLVVRRAGQKVALDVKP